jgi:hypothetical protein
VIAITHEISGNNCDRLYKQSANQARSGNKLKFDRANIVTIPKAANAGIQVMVSCLGKAWLPIATNLKRLCGQDTIQERVECELRSLVQVWPAWQRL